MFEVVISNRHMVVTAMKELKKNPLRKGQCIISLQRTLWH